MGMTIKELMLNLHTIQDYYNGDVQDGYVGFDRKDNESVDLAIQTIRKYQKIEQIVNKWHQDPEVKDFDCMAEVADVFEDFEEGGEPLWYQAMDLD